MADLAWAVAETVLRGEARAAMSLAEHQFDYWLPYYLKLMKGYRFEGTRRVRSRSDFPVPRPLFPGYVFVLVPHGAACREIDFLYGVKRLIRHAGGAPKIVRARIVEQLREVVDMGLWQDNAGALHHGKPEGLRPNQRVKTPAGIVAIVLSLDDKGRADLLATLMGQETVIRRVEAASLEVLE